MGWFGQSAPHKVRLVIAIVCSAILLCVPAFINGNPIIGGDTVQYLLDGKLIAGFHKPPGIRPIFYGLATFLLSFGFTIWPVVLAQSLVVAHLIYLLLRTVRPGLPPIITVYTTSVLCLLSSVAWHTSLLLPDVFTGVIIVTLFLLGFYGNRLSWGETAYIFLLTDACICFHLTNLAIAIAATGMVSLAWLVWPACRRLVRPALLAACVLTSLIVYFSFSLVAWHRLSFTMYRQPHVMARLIADGPGRAFLQRACPKAGYEICSFVDQLPATEQEILWHFLYGLPIQDWTKFRAEESQEVVGTFLMYPREVALGSLMNTLRQFVSIDPEVNDDPPFLALIQREIPSLGAEAEGTIQFHGGFRGSVPNLLTRLNQVSAVIGIIGCIAIGRSCIRRGRKRSVLLMGTVLFGLWANAFVCGALSGVFGRYQSRVSWLVLLCLITGAIELGIPEFVLRHPFRGLRSRVLQQQVSE